MPSAQIRRFPCDSVAGKGRINFQCVLSSELTKGKRKIHMWGDIWRQHATLQSFIWIRKFWKWNVNPSLNTFICLAHVGKFDGKYMGPNRECGKSINGKLYGNRRNNRILPEISYYLAELLTQTFTGENSPAGMNVETEMWPSVSNGFRPQAISHTRHERCK